MFCSAATLAEEMVVQQSHGHANDKSILAVWTWDLRPSITHLRSESFSAEGDTSHSLDMLCRANTANRRISVPKAEWFVCGNRDFRYCPHARTTYADVTCCSTHHA
jgi:hypothetical protein